MTQEGTNKWALVFCILSPQVLLQAFCDSILQVFRFFGFAFFDFTPFIEQQLQKVYPTDFYTVSWVDAFGVVSAHSCGKVWRVDLDFFKGVCVRFGPHKGMEERLGWFMLCLCWEFRWYMLKARHLKCCWCVDSKRQTPLANFFTSIHRILFKNKIFVVITSSFANSTLEKSRSYASYLCFCSSARST